jgi:hypothetical protein
VLRTRETSAKVSTETAYYLLSTPLSAERFGGVARAHWGVENGLHWVLDVTMNEDQARTRKDHGPQNIALLRRLALNLAKLEGSKESMKAKRMRAAWDDTFPRLIHADRWLASNSSLKRENFAVVARDESKQPTDRLRRRRFTQRVTHVPRQVIEFLRC